MKKEYIRPESIVYELPTINILQMSTETTDTTGPGGPEGGSGFGDDDGTGLTGDGTWG